MTVRPKGTSDNMDHVPISPAIFYWGSPVVLITTKNPDLSTNICPMSSAWWIGNSCLLGLSNTSQTTVNLLRTGECVLNLVDDSIRSVEAVNALAKTTGTENVPERKKERGYVHVKDKFEKAGLTPIPSTQVSAPGILECPVLMEARLIARYDMFTGKPYQGGCLAIEVEILNTRIRPDLKLAGYANRIDTDRWKPMIMMFAELYGLREGRLQCSKLAEIDEELYRLPKAQPKESQNGDASMRARQLGVPAEKQEELE